jgi:hypothetical protein
LKSNWEALEKYEDVPGVNCRGVSSCRGRSVSVGEIGRKARAAALVRKWLYSVGKTSETVVVLELGALAAKVSRMGAKAQMDSE